MFEELEFSKACDELTSPNIEGWELFTENQTVKIYRFYHEVSGLYSYKVYGELVGITPEVCATVYTDLNYRKEWDSYVKELKEIHEAGESGIYWQVKFPFPLYNRDYTFIRELRELDIDGQHFYVFLAKAHIFPSVPPVSAVVRISEYTQSLAITSNGEGGTKAFMQYFENLGGIIPSWLINWAAQTGVPSFLNDMQKACEGYADYLKRKGLP